MVVVQGENDPYGTMEQVNRIANGIGPKAQILSVPNCGHTPHREARDFVLKNILKL